MSQKLQQFQTASHVTSNKTPCRSANGNADANDACQHIGEPEQLHARDALSTTNLIFSFSACLPRVLDLAHAAPQAAHPDVAVHWGQDEVPIFHDKPRANLSRRTWSMSCEQPSSAIVPWTHIKFNLHDKPLSEAEPEGT